MGMRYVSFGQRRSVKQAQCLRRRTVPTQEAALRMPRDDQSPPPAEFSDSDIEEEEEEEEEEDPELEEEEEDPEIIEEEEEDEEEDPEIVEEAEEEEEEEEEEEDELKMEERVEVDMDITDSPIRVHDDHNDARRDYRSEGIDGIHPSESHGDSKAYLCSTEIMHAKAANSSSVAGEEDIQIRDHLGNEVKSVMNPEDEMKQEDIQLRNDRKQVDSRPTASEIGTRILSPVAETSGRNKRPAIICDFFAKGWCIRGSSCKFVHIKDNPNSTHPQPEGDVAASNCTNEVQLDEGLRDITERSRSPGFPDPLASSSGSSFAFPSQLSSEKIRFSEHIGMQRRHQFLENCNFPSVLGEESNVGKSTDAQKLQSSKDDPGFLSSLKDVGRDGQTRNWLADGYNKPPNHKGHSIFMGGLPESGFFLNGSIAPSGKYSMGNPLSHSSSMEEPAGIWSQRMHSDHTSPLVSLSLNSRSSNLLTNGLFPSTRISSWNGLALPSSYSCLDASPCGTQKLLDGNRDYRSSMRSSPLLKSSPPFSSSELKLPSTSVSLRSAELKTKISSNDWEPSVPFRPSFILPPAFLSSSGSQYDPLRDSIELPKLGNISFEGAPIGNRLHPQIHGESVSGTMRPACDGETNSMSSHNTYHEKVLDNSCYTREQNSPITEAETVGTSVVCQNGTMTLEENPLGPSHLKGSTKPNKTSEYGDSRQQSDSSRHIKVFRENNEVDGEHLTDGDVQQESKSMRHFRAALVELVKELLKPKWREGCLSKDAHNKIVKKAVEKILSAFQPHQIPPTIETVVQYLTACRPKISKLVEGYVDKYGKS